MSHARSIPELLLYRATKNPMSSIRQLAIAIAIAVIASPLVGVTQEKTDVQGEGTRVQLVDELGRATNLVADGKKQERVTGDGEFKSVTRLEGARLVVEEDFGGPKVTTTYERIASDGESRLQVTLQIDGTPDGRVVAARAPRCR